MQIKINFTGDISNAY